MSANGVIGHLRMSAAGLLLGAASVVAFGAASKSTVQIDYSSIQKEGASQSLESLMKRAWGCVERERYDSAAAYYSVAASRFSESLPEREKRRCATACVNMGYIWLAWRMNAAEAYPWLMRAQEIAIQNGFADIETSVISNLGQLYFDYNNLPKAIGNFHDAVIRVMEEGSDRYYGRALLDFATAAVYGDDANAIADIAGRVASHHIGDTVQLSAYSRNLAGTLSHYASGNIREAAELMEAATEMFDATPDGKRYLAMHHLLAGRLWRHASDPAKGMEHLQKAIEIASREGFYNMMEKGYDEMEECSAASGDMESTRMYRDRGAGIRDSLFNASRFEVVKDLEISKELNGLHERVRKATVEAEVQRTRTVWSTVSGSILLVALICLFFYNRRLKSAYREIFKRNLELSEVGSRVREETTPDPQPEMVAMGEEETERLKEVLEKVTDVFETSREIYSPDFSVDRLAELVESRPKTVSQAINALAGKNFNTLLGEHRVREACRILADVGRMKSMSMEGVAECVGYRSRTYFSRVFKTVTGLTPTQFAKQARDAV